MTTDPAADVSVIIVNYGTADLALEAAASVLAHSHGGRIVDLHLVDNASPGDDAARLAAAIAARGWGGRVTFYAETVNHGFGCGNNLVLAALARRRAPPAYVFLLNPDARLGNEAIAILADFLDAHPRAGAAGARIEKPGGLPVRAAFRFPGLISESVGALSFGPVARLFRRWEVALPPDIPTSRVDWVSGAAVMLRFGAAQEAGFFDPGYFLYHEEVDLMRKMARNQWKTWHVGEALAIHAEGTATGVRSGESIRRRRPDYWYHSWFYYFRKNHGRPFAILVSLGRVSGALLNHAIAALRRRPPAAPLFFFRDFWSMVGRPLVGLKARPHD